MMKKKYQIRVYHPADRTDKKSYSIARNTYPEVETSSIRTYIAAGLAKEQAEAIVKELNKLDKKLRKWKKRAEELELDLVCEPVPKNEDDNFDWLLFIGTRLCTTRFPTPLAAFVDWGLYPDEVRYSRIMRSDGKFYYPINPTPKDVADLDFEDLPKLSVDNLKEDYPVWMSIDDYFYAFYTSMDQLKEQLPSILGEEFYGDVLITSFIGDEGKKLYDQYRVLRSSALARDAEPVYTLRKIEWHR